MTEAGDGEPRGPLPSRALGPPPRPSSRYSVIVGLLFLVAIILVVLNSISDGGEGMLGLDEEAADLPLPEFAVPVAVSDLPGDANVAQDDCASAEIPCPADAGRTPACRVRRPT